MSSANSTGIVLDLVRLLSCEDVSLVLPVWCRPGVCPGISVLCCSEAMRPGSPVGSFKPQAVVSVSADPPGDLSVLPVHSGPACSLGSGWLTPRISGQSLRDRQPECIRNFKGHFPKPLPLCNLPGVRCTSQLPGAPLCSAPARNLGFQLPWSAEHFL